MINKLIGCIKLFIFSYLIGHLVLLVTDFISSVLN